MKTPHKRDVVKPPSPTSCSKQVQHATQVRLLRVLSSWVLGYTISWGNRLQFFIILSDFSLVPTWNLPCHNLRPLSLVLQPCTSVKSLALSFKQLLCGRWKATGRSPLNHLSSRLYKPSSLSFSLEGTFSSPRPSRGPSNRHTHKFINVFLYLPKTRCSA